MATTSNQYLREVVTAIANLKKSFGDSEFILVGGASLICQGSERITADVDILLPGTSVPCIALIVKQSPEVKDSLEAGNLDRFLAIGGNKFQVPWDEDTEDQRECYTILMADAEDAVDQLEDAVIKEVSGITSGSPRIKRKF